MISRYNMVIHILFWVLVSVLGLLAVLMLLTQRGQFDSHLIKTETEIIIAAQKSRGLQIDRGNIFKRARKMLPLLIPIFASAMRRSWQLAEAIESRGWNAIKKRTYLYSLKLKWWDFLIIILSLALFALFLVQAIKQYPYPEWVTWHIPEKYELKRLLSIAWNWFKGLFRK